MATPLDCLCLSSPQFHSQALCYILTVCPVGVAGPVGSRGPNPVPGLRERQIVLEYSTKWITVTVMQGLKKGRGCYQDTGGICYW